MKASQSACHFSFALYNSNVLETRYFLGQRSLIMRQNRSLSFLSAQLKTRYPTLDAIARNGSEVIPIVSDEGVSDVIKSRERASPLFSEDIRTSSRHSPINSLRRSNEHTSRKVNGTDRGVARRSFRSTFHLWRIARCVISYCSLPATFRITWILWIDEKALMASLLYVFVAWSLNRSDASSASLLTLRRARLFPFTTFLFKCVCGKKKEFPTKLLCVFYCHFCWFVSLI